MMIDQQTSQILKGNEGMIERKKVLERKTGKMSRKGAKRMVLKPSMQ